MYNHAPPLLFKTERYIFDLGKLSKPKYNYDFDILEEQN